MVSANIGEGVGQYFRKQSLLTTYEQYRSQIKTGDVIAFSGNAGFSHFIRWATGSIYSHVGIVLNTDLGTGGDDSVLVIESRTDTKGRDAAGAQLVKGVQLHWLSKRILGFDGAVWLFPLQRALDAEKQARMQSWLRQTNNQVIAYDAIQTLGAGLDMFDRVGLTFNDENLSTLFCSELVAKALQIAGLLDDNLNPSEFTPSDVVNLPLYGQPLQFKSDSDPLG
ncbi:MAG: hypothetical protein ACFB9N_13875 [Geitlerinemataceae cyanobacterium]